MKILFLFVFVLFSKSAFSTSPAGDSCTPNTIIKGVLFPNVTECPFSKGFDCYTQVRARDKSLIVLSFRLIIDSLTQKGGEHFEANNTGYSFSPFIKNILIRAEKGALFQFTCINAKARGGNVLILQPFAFRLK